MFNENTTSNATENMTSEDQKMKEYVNEQIDNLYKEMNIRINQVHHNFTKQLEAQRDLISNISNRPHPFFNPAVNLTGGQFMNSNMHPNPPMHPQQFVNSNMHLHPPFNAGIHSQQPGFNNFQQFPVNSNMHFQQPEEYRSSLGSTGYKDINKLSDKLYNVNCKLKHSLQVSKFSEQDIEKLSSLIDELDMKFYEFFKSNNNGNNN